MTSARTKPALPRVVLRKNLARSIRRGHPWIYRDALTAPEGLADGALVFVVDADRKGLARGFWDARSPIAVRVVATADEAAGADVDAVIDARLGAALDRRAAFIDRAETDAFRWIHGEADRLPGIHVDLYGDVAVVRADGAGARAFYRDLPTRLAAAAARGLALRAVVERTPEGEAAVATLGVLPEAELEVRENGVRFGVDLARGQKGGLFLDQRDNRALVGTLAAGRRVLNLFGYTGGFSIYAARGGASETTTVDVAAPAIAAARRNGVAIGLRQGRKAAARLEPSAVIGRQRVEQAGVGGTRRAAHRSKQFALRRRKRVATRIAFGERASQRARYALCLLRRRLARLACGVSEQPDGICRQPGLELHVARWLVCGESQGQSTLSGVVVAFAKRAARAADEQPQLALARLCAQPRFERRANRAGFEIIERAGQVGEGSALCGVHGKSHKTPLVARFLATRERAPRGSRRSLTRITRFDDILIQRALPRAVRDGSAQLFGHDTGGLRGLLDRRRRVVLRQAQVDAQTRTARSRLKRHAVKGEAG